MSDSKIDVQKKCLEMSSEGKTARQIFLEYYSKEVDPNLQYESFRRKLIMWKNKEYPNRDILQKARLDRDQYPYAATVQVDAQGNHVQSWIRTKSKDSLYMELIEEIKCVEPIPYRRVQKKTGRQDLLEIPLYDMHFGISTLADYENTLDDILELLEKNYKEVLIVIGQDLFHNDDFRGRTTSGTPIEQVNMIKAWNDALEFYSSIIMASPVPPTILYSQGNHDETLGWAFVQLLKAKFPDIIVDDSRDDRKIYCFGQNVIGFTHGDKVKGKPINLMGVFLSEFPKEFSSAKVKEIHAGHLHHEKSEDVYGVMCRTLSTGNLTDSWHKDKGFIGQNKRFTVFEWSEEKLKSIHYV